MFGHFIYVLIFNKIGAKNMKNKYKRLEILTITFKNK